MLLFKVCDSMDGPWVPNTAVGIKRLIRPQRHKRWRGPYRRNATHSLPESGCEAACQHVVHPRCARISLATLTAMSTPFDELDLSDDEMDGDYEYYHEEDEGVMEEDEDEYTDEDEAEARDGDTLRTLQGRHVATVSASRILIVMLHKPWPIWRTQPVGSTQRRVSMHPG